MNPKPRFLTPLALLVGAPFANAQLTAVQVASGLDQPDGLYASPNDPTALYVTQKGGKVQIVRNGVVESTAVDVSGLIATDGERGLLGMAFAPDYAASGRVYLSYVDDASKALRVVRTTNFDLSTSQTIVDLPHAKYNNHYGGGIKFGPEGDLYIGIGDGGSGNDPDNNAQNKDVLLGKILRLDVSGGGAGYAIPADNPFAGGGGRGEIWAYGLRNPFKYSFDGDDLYIGDVGQDRYEEIDAAFGNPGGLNYGWRVREGLHDNPANGDALPSGLTDPIFEYDHSQGQSITGGFVYRGSALGSAYVGRYFFGDFVQGRLWSIDPRALDLAASLQEYTDGLGVGGSIVSIDPDANGEIIVTYFGGNAYRLQAVPEPATLAALGLGALAFLRRRRKAA